jgi:hypothetical protein
MTDRRQEDGVAGFSISQVVAPLLDFAKMMDLFERHRVSLVSVTQQFNWASVRVVCVSGTRYRV